MSRQIAAILARAPRAIAGGLELPARAEIRLPATMRDLLDGLYTGAGQEDLQPDAPPAVGTYAMRCGATNAIGRGGRCPAVRGDARRLAWPAIQRPVVPAGGEVYDDPRRWAPLCRALRDWMRERGVPCDLDHPLNQRAGWPLMRYYRRELERTTGLDWMAFYHRQEMEEMEIGEAAWDWHEPQLPYYDRFCGSTESAVPLIEFWEQLLAFHLGGRRLLDVHLPEAAFAVDVAAGGGMKMKQRLRPQAWVDAAESALRRMLADGDYARVPQAAWRGVLEELARRRLDRVCIESGFGDGSATLHDAASVERFLAESAAIGDLRRHGDELVLGYGEDPPTFWGTFINGLCDIGSVANPRGDGNVVPEQHGPDAQPEAAGTKALRPAQRRAPKAAAQAPQGRRRRRRAGAPPESAPQHRRVRRGDRALPTRRGQRRAAADRARRGGQAVRPAPPQVRRRRAA